MTLETEHGFGTGLRSVLERKLNGEPHDPAAAFEVELD